MCSENEIDNARNIFTSTIQCCLKSSTTKMTQQWIYSITPNHVRKLIQYKNRLRKRFQRNHNLNQYQEYDDAVDLVRATVHSLKTSKWEDFARNLNNSNDMWKFLRSLKNTKNSSRLSTNSLNHYRITRPTN